MSLVTPIHGACPERSEWAQGRLREESASTPRLALGKWQIRVIQDFTKDVISTVREESASTPCLALRKWHVLVIQIFTKTCH